MRRQRPRQLVEAVAERVTEGPVAARILLPLAPVPDAWTWDEDATHQAMLRALDEAIGETPQHRCASRGHDRLRP
jgi:hypothetical protein